MRIVFRTNHLRRNYEVSALAIREWGPVVGRRYVTRITELYDAKDFQTATQVRSMRLHPLRGQAEGRWAINLTGAWRLIISRGASEQEIIIEEVSNHYGD